MSRRVSYNKSNGGKIWKWGFEAPLGAESETLILLTAANRWESKEPPRRCELATATNPSVTILPTALCCKRGVLSYRCIEKLGHDWETLAEEAFVWFLSELKLYLMECIAKSFAEDARELPIRFCVTVPPYLTASQFGWFLWHAEEQLGLVSLVYHAEACLTWFESKVPLTPSLNEFLISCNLEEESINSFRALVSSVRGNRYNSQYADSFAVGSADIGENFQKCLENQVEDRLTAPEFVNVDRGELVLRLKHFMLKFLADLHRCEAKKEVKLKVRVTIRHPNGNKPLDIPLRVSAKQLQEEIFNPVLDLISKHILAKMPLGHRTYVIFSGPLGECPYLHSYMRDLVMSEYVSTTLGIDARIMETCDESTSGCLGAVISKSKHGSIGFRSSFDYWRTYDRDNDQFKYHRPRELYGKTILASRIAIDGPLQKLDRAQAILAAKDFLTLDSAEQVLTLKQYESILSERILRQGYCDSATKSAVLTVVSMEKRLRRLGLPGHAKDICQNWTRGYINEQKYRLNKDEDLLNIPGVEEAVPIKVSSEIHFATSIMDQNAVQIILASGSDINTRLPGAFGVTPLHISAARGAGFLTEFLIRGGADLNAKTESQGHTALHFAVHCYRETTARHLLHSGANVNASFDNEHMSGLTSLHLAAKRGHSVIVRLLLEHNANPDLVARDTLNNIEYTAIKYAEDNNHHEVTQILQSKSPNHRLHQAVQSGDENGMIQAIQSGADVNSKVEKGHALFKAIERGHLHSVRVLLEYGADIESKETVVDKRTPITTKQIEASTLSFAALNGHTDIGEILLERGANPNSTVLVGDDPDVELMALRIAEIDGYTDFIRRVVEDGPGVELTALHIAAAKGFTDFVRMLLGHGVDVDQKSETFENYGATALHYATFYERKSVVDLLLSHQADPNAEFASGGQWERPLHLASSRLNLGITKALLEHGADINALLTVGWTNYAPLHLVVMGLGDIDAMIELLLDNGAKVGAIGSHIPLYYASRRGHKLAIQLLGEKTLLFGLTEGDAGAIRDALSAGTDPDTKWDHQPALYTASEWDDIPIVTALLEGGSSVNMDDGGETSLYVAADRGHEAVVRLLLDHGAMVDKGRRDGRTPLFAAATRNHEAIGCLLIQRGASIATAMNSMRRRQSEMRRRLEVWERKSRIHNPPTTPMTAPNPTESATPTPSPNHPNGIYELDGLAMDSGELNSRQRVPTLPDLQKPKGGAIVSRELDNRQRVSIPRDLQEPDIANAIFALHFGQVGAAESFLRSHHAIVDTSLENANKGDLWHVMAPGEFLENVRNRQPELFAVLHHYHRSPFYTESLSKKADQMSSDFMSKSISAIKGHDRELAIYLSVINGRASLLRRLLQDGVSADHSDNRGRSLLHFAVWCSKTEIMSVLLSHGANVDSRNIIGETPLHWAAMKGDELAIELLLSARADINATDNEGATPLRRATELNLWFIASFLLKNGARTNEPVPQGSTPLHMAVDSLNSNFTKFILAQGFDVNAKNAHGQTPFHIAAAKPDSAASPLSADLLRYEPDLGILDNDGRTALKLASQAGNAGIARMMVNQYWAGKHSVAWI